MLKEAKRFLKNNNNKYRMRYGRENWELEFNNLARKWKILLIDSIISYQIQNEEKKQPHNETTYTHIVLSQCNMLRQIAMAPIPSVCFKYALYFLFGLAIRTLNARDIIKATVTYTLKIYTFLQFLMVLLVIILFLLPVPYHYRHHYHL